MDEEDKKLTQKERMKQFRKEQYRKAKEKYKNSEYGKLMKEKQKELRKKSYLLAKQRRQQKTSESNNDETFQPAPEKKIETSPAPVKGPPKLRLIVNDSFHNNEK